MKVFRALLILFLSISLLTFISCEPEDSADVNQDRIYTDYELFYDANTDVSRLLASFRFGTSILGTPLKLENPAKVVFNDTQLSYTTILFGHTLEKAGLVSPGGVFVYTNTDGDTFTNQIPVYNGLDFPSELREIDKGSAFELTWEGLPLGANEEIAVFTGSFDTEDALFFTNTEGATSIILEKDKLENLTTGENTFYMERTLRLDAVEKTSAGGRLRVRFRTENQVITLID